MYLIKQGGILFLMNSNFDTLTFMTFRLSSMETPHVLGFTLKACAPNRNTCFLHLSLSMADSSWVRLGQFEHSLRPDSGHSFSPPSFHSFYPWLKHFGELFFHTVPVQSNEPIVSENLQPSSSETEGSGEQLWKIGPWLLQFVLANACEMWCVNSTRDLPRSVHTGPSCVPSGVVK